MRPVLIFLLIILALIGYLTPWIVNSPAGLTLHAYDLAEWTSLHPLVRTEMPVLFTTTLLRLPMVCLAVMLATLATRKNYGWLRVIVLLIAISLLPPLEFVTQLDNPNYRQQFLWTVLCIIGFGASFLRLLLLSATWIGLAAGIIGAIAGIIGLERTSQLMRSFAMPAQLGVGVFLWSLSMALFAVLLLREVLPLKSEQGSSFKRTTLPR